MFAVAMMLLTINMQAQISCVGGSPTSPGANFALATCTSTAAQAISVDDVVVSTVVGICNPVVTVMSLGGTPIPNTPAGLKPYVGKVVQVSVTTSGVLCTTTGTCWGYVKIEDKTAPTCAQPANVTLACSEAGLVATPGATGQYTEATNQFSGTLLAARNVNGSALAAAANGTAVECSKFEQSYTDAGTINPCTGGTITRTWILKDQWGNTTVSPCVQTITVLASPAYTAPTFSSPVLQCQNVNAQMREDLNNGLLHLPAVDQTCGLTLRFKSARELSICSGSYKVIRQFEVINMCPKVGESMINGPYEQIIQVVDQTAPTAEVTYQDFDVKALDTCFYMNGMKMTSLPSTYLQSVKNLVPVTKPFTGSVTIAPATTAPVVINFTPLADANMCGAANVFLTIKGSDDNCTKDEIVWSSNDSRIKFSTTASGAGSSTLSVAGGTSVYVKGFLMVSQGTDFTVYGADKCGNIVTQNFHANIIDNVSPQPVCVEETRASLNSNGTVRIYASSFNNRSSDNCGIERISVKRMDKRNQSTASGATVCDYATVPTSTSCTSADIRDYWNDYVDFDCGDLNRTDVMVWVRYVDAAGNFSDCMVNVTVDDKTAPICMKPDDITINCNDAGLNNYRSLFTTPSAYDNCGIKSTTNDDLALVINCGKGSVTRTWTFTDCANKTATCAQTLTVLPKYGFKVPRIANQTKACALGTTDIATILENDKTTIINGASLTHTSTAGGNVNTCSAPVVEAEYWKYSSSQYCQIYRIRYTIIDNCAPYYNYTLGAIDECGINNNYGVLETACPVVNSTTPGRIRSVVGATVGGVQQHVVIYERFIYVTDTEAPVPGDVTGIDVCDGSTTDKDADECQGGIDVTLNGSDNCGTSGTNPSSPDKLYFSWRAIRNSTGAVLTSTNFASGTSTSSADVKLRNLILGESYTVYYRVSDLCGNLSNEKNFTVVVRDCKAPEIRLHDKVVALAGQTGVRSSGWASLDYEDIKNFIWDNCDEDLTNSNKVHMELVLPTDPANPTAPRALTTPGTKFLLNVFDCSHVGIQKVRVWARDNSLPANWNYGVSTITVQDNDNICNNAFSVSGGARTESNAVVNNITVSASANGTTVASGDVLNGTYSFTVPASATNVQVRAAKNNNEDAASGVTTFDIAKVSQHVLDIEKLATPYKLIAADVDKSGEVDATDMLHMRRFILKITPALPGGNFRFVDKAYSFRNAANPFGEDFPEVVSIATLASNASANFVAVKLGDVNDSYAALAPRSSRTLSFLANDMSVVAGNEYTVNISADKMDAAAFQGTFSFNGATVKSVKAGDLANMTDGNFGVFANAVTTSWNGKTQASAEVLAITFVATKSGKLSEMLTINSELTQAVANDATGAEMNVNLKFNTGKVAGGEFALYQNQPNPVANETTIGFNLPKDGTARLTVTAVDGKVVKVINGDYKAGYNTISVNKSDLNATGVFYYRLETADHSASKKMVIIE